MKRLAFLLTVLPLLLAACAAAPLPVATSAASTALPPTPFPKVPRSGTPSPTASPLPPAVTATPWPVEGTLAVRVNVRGGPGTSYASLGLLNPGEKVLIFAQDPTGSWYQVRYPAATGGLGWVTAQFVQIPTGTQVPPPVASTPAGPGGRVLQRLNVRSGPGLSFDSLGMLEPDLLVSLTGKNTTASWLQIDYPSGPGGHAWVTAQYIQADAADLPVLDDYGTPVASGTAGATSIPEPPTPTVGPAYADNDSPASPGVRVTFSASGTRQFTYASQVSAPQGDPADWVAFTPYAVNAADARLVFSLACSGSGTLTVEISQAGSPLSGWGALACGDSDKVIALPAGKDYQLHLAPAPGAGLQLVDYVLTVQNLP